MNLMTSEAVMALLRARHSNDVFVAECKTGPTQTAGARPIRLDAWAMPRSWAHPAVHGYEVKVSRQDFLRDEKWQEYMAYCNCMWFVAPKSLIQLEELPAEVGLLEVSKNAKRLFTRRKAVDRDVEIPESIWRYVLMSRARITGTDIKRHSQREIFEAWLADKRANKQLGWMVRGKIREIVEEVNRKNDRLEDQIREFDHVRAILEEAGIDSVSTWRTREELRKKIEAQTSGVRADLKRDLSRAQKAIEALVESLED